MQNVWISQTAAGQPVRWRGWTLTPFANTLGLRLPIPSRFAAAQWTWTRPISVLVVDENGNETILPVVNITRRITWTLYGVCAALALAAGLYGLIKQRRWR